jgi:hypothetical protein
MYQKISRMNLSANSATIAPSRCTLAQHYFSIAIAAALLLTGCANLRAAAPESVRSIADLRALSVVGLTNDTVVIVNDYYYMGVPNRRMMAVVS